MLCWIGNSSSNSIALYRVGSSRFQKRIRKSPSVKWQNQRLMAKNWGKLILSLILDHAFLLHFAGSSSAPSRSHALFSPGKTPLMVLSFPSHSQSALAAAGFFSRTRRRSARPRERVRHPATEISIAPAARIKADTRNGKNLFVRSAATKCECVR